jgi:hypothetical protein
MWLIVNKRPIVGGVDNRSRVKNKGETGRHRNDLPRPYDYGTTQALNYCLSHPNQVHR